MKPLKILPSALLASSIVACVFFSWFYLVRSAAQFGTEFGSQNFSELSRADTYALTQRLNALSKSDTLACVDARRNNMSFFRSGRTTCTPRFYEKAIKIENGSGDGHISINVIMGFSNAVWWALATLSIFQILVVLSVRKVTRLSERMRHEAEARVIELAAQVAHDIRSPLSALNMMTALIDEVPEDRRTVIRNAVQRINDIANGLLQQSKTEKSGVVKLANHSSVSLANDKKTLNEPILVAALLDSIVSEKRMQYRDRLGIEILGDFNQGYGLFADISSTEMARAVSNIVNNSVEACGEVGRIVIAIRSQDQRIAIEIRDNGKGIPSEILGKLGDRGFTHGKTGTASGTGLGLAHAREFVENAGGEFRIESYTGIGTKITLTLPCAQTPAWFLDHLDFPAGSTVVSADDDQTIHQIWEGRLSHAGSAAAQVGHVKLSTIDQLKAFVASSKSSQSIRYLVDYEFLSDFRGDALSVARGKSENGLDVIEQMGIAKNAVLVTSRYEEMLVRSRAEEMGLKILPKALAPFIPISI